MAGAIDLLPRRPGKIFAVHANFRSRARQRGRDPKYPTYFLKPSTSLAASGDPVVRPHGFELLTCEGEITLVIGRTARDVTVEQGWDHVGWVTAANDVGAHDIRYADVGSNLKSKGADGYTPVGPALIDARTIDWKELRLQTWLNGVEIQNAAVADDLIFGFDFIVADLSRYLTLEEGDLILTGTPAGATSVEPGDLVEVEVSAGSATTGRLQCPIVQGKQGLEPIGALPRVDDATREFALGIPPAPPGGHVDQEVIEGLRGVATATLSAQLRRRGHDDLAMTGLRSTRPELKLVGRARTLRYLPFREDLFAERGGGMNAQKQAVELVQPGEVLVIDARREPGAGTIGDVLALRVKERGGAGIVTDGALRDSATIASLEMPTFHAATHPAVLGHLHVPWETGTAVACAGVLVQPGDIVVGDEDGVVVVPPSLAAEVLADAVEQERQERFIAERVRDGESVDGLFPLGEKWRPAYEQWCAEREKR